MLRSGAVIGILGGGQLGRMLAIAAAQLGFQTHIYAPEAGCSAAQIATTHTKADYGDEVALEKFAQSVAVISFEFENIPLATAKFLAERQDFFPSAKILAITQDRLMEKKFLNELGLKTAPWAEAHDYEKISPPAFIKSQRFGYDGKGQMRVESFAEMKKACATLKTPSIIEQQVNFNQEIAICAARDKTGAMVFYDPVQTEHKAGILRRVQAPANIHADLRKEAIAITHQIAEALDYVGVLAVEMFEVDGVLSVNEIAPRVHNSGHWTIEACTTSQFSQHIRALAGWPLASTERFADAIMINIIGDDPWQPYLNQSHQVVHLYNKGEAKPGRKMGHITQILPWKS